jgi:hypothetical protein
VFVLVIVLFYKLLELLIMPPKKNPQPTDNTEAPASEGENFQETLKSAGFNEKSIEKLQKSDFDTVQSLDILATEPDIYGELGLSIQQRLLLKQFVKQRTTTQDGVTGVPGGPTSGPTPLQHIVSELQASAQGGPTLQAPHTAASFPGTIEDPQVYLQGHKGGFANSKNSFRDIVNYINLVPPVAEEQILCADGGIQLVYKGGVRHPQLTSVSIEEWALANTRIMNEMCMSGELKDVALSDYMAYTVKICELFKYYDRVSVLNYDREYRHLQSVYNFRWATDTPHLQTTCLRRRQIVPHYSDNKQGKTDGTSGHARRNVSAEVCRLYNTASGCRFKDNCKYTHRCNEPGCSASHSRAHAHISRPASSEQNTASSE